MTGREQKGLVGCFRAGDSNVAEMRALHLSLLWILRNNWSNYVIFSYSKVTVDNVTNKAKYIDRYAHLTTVCRGLLQEAQVQALQKGSRWQTQGADALTKTMLANHVDLDNFLVVHHSPTREFNCITNSALNLIYVELCNLGYFEQADSLLGDSGVATWHV